MGIDGWYWLRVKCKGQLLGKDIQIFLDKAREELQCKRYSLFQQIKQQMFTVNDITTSNMTSGRRAPPLPGRGIQSSAVMPSKYLERNTLPQQPALTFTKKTSQVSFNHEVERRRTLESNTRPAVDLVQSAANIPLESHRVSNLKNNTCTEIIIANDLLQILKDQNKNLKEQNNFLLSKVRQISESQRALKEALLKYEFLVNQLSEDNRELKLENRELTEIANRKVNEFGNKLAELITDVAETQSQTAEKYREPAFQHFQSTGNPAQFYTLLNQFNSSPGVNNSMPPIPPKQQHTKADMSTEPNDSLMDELNNQFDALLYSCSVEKNLENRKEIRKKLLELTNKMREIKR